MAVIKQCEKPGFYTRKPQEKGVLFGKNVKAADIGYGYNEAGHCVVTIDLASVAKRMKNQRARRKAGNACL